MILIKQPNCKFRIFKFQNNFDFKTENKILMINLWTFQEGKELSLRHKLFFSKPFILTTTIDIILTTTIDILTTTIDIILTTTIDISNYEFFTENTNIKGLSVKVAQK